MTGNQEVLRDIRSFNGGYVNFAGDKGGRVTGEGTVSNGSVTFEKSDFLKNYNIIY